MDAEHGARFFTGYGAATQDLWRTFGQCLTTAVHGEAEETLALHAAQSVFLHLESWMAQYGLLK